MERQFWLERWNRQEIGFHQQSVNAQLPRFWGDLGVAPGGAVFVPLSGKSGDMMWLRAQGHTVLGVELSPLAIAAFFTENGLTPRWRRRGAFQVAEADGIRILLGDFFDLVAGDLADAKGVYDRAALVALPPGTRERYASHMAAILPPGTRMLLVTLEYPPAQMEGPPFSVPPAEVERLYRPHGDVRLLSRDDVLPRNPHFAERGLTALQECTCLVTIQP